MKQRLAQVLAAAVDLPGESLPGQPLLELYGEHRVLIENHMGILEYGTERIRIRVRYGALCISGSGLRLCSMQDRQLVIMGCIDSVGVVRRNG